MTIINTSPDRIIQLGYEGEDRVTVLRFRYSDEWLSCGEGIFRIRVRRHGENHAYNAQLLTADLTHMELLMTVTNVELSVKGSGEMQVVYSGADFVKKSPIYSYNVSRAVDEAVDPPAQDVYTQIIESLSDLQTDVNGLSDAVDGIGNLADLTTTAKTDLVSAINEVNNKSVDITVDDALSATSENPVQNKVVTSRIVSAESAIASAQTAIQGKADTQTVSALADAVNDLDTDIQDALDGKVDKNGTWQVKPKNIDGITVSGGNVLEDAERLYCTQPGIHTTDGYVIIQNGTALIQAAAPYCSFLIAVKPNTHYAANHSIRFAVLLKNLSSEGTTPVRYSTVVGSALVNISSFDTGEADHIIVSWNYNTYPIDNFIISEGNTPTADKTITLPDWWTGGSTPKVVEKPKFATVTGNMVSGGDLQLPSVRSNLRKGERIVFEGNITNFSTLTIGLTRFTSDFGNDANSRNIFVIDGTNITYKAYPTATAVAVPHGLTISGNIQIIWEMTATASCKITLISNGVLFAHEFTNFVRQVIGNPFVYSANSELTGCKLTWTCTDIDKKIWMFGDSYFGYSNVRWTYYLHQYGYDNNCLLDGFPGEGGVNGRVAFNNLLQFGTPKYAVWCLGMNDTTDSESAPATNWVNARQYFLQYCQNNNVTPIFGTIPTVPTINHEQKNAWIRSSGYRYIDFAKAVGASASGAWFSGMLSSDGIHPTKQGARALFAQVLLDFPEIMVDNLT